MKTTTFIKQVAVLLSLLVGAVLHTVAQPGPGGPAGLGARMRIELTGDQQAKVREARQASQTERAQLSEKLTAAQKEAITAALAEKPDEKTVRAKVDAVAKIQTELGLLNFKTFKDVKLTDEQKEQLTSHPPLGYMIFFGGMGPGGMGPGFGAGGGRSGGSGGGGAGGFSGGVNK